MLTARIARHLDVRVCRARIAHHGDGDDTVEDVRRSLRKKHVFVVQPLCKPYSIWLCQLCVIADAARRASARHVTAVIPYYPGRQDRKHKRRTPITARLIADLLRTAGFDGVIMLDVHSLPTVGFFSSRMRVDHVEAHPLIVAHLMSNHRKRRVAFAGADGNATKRFAAPLLEYFPGATLATLEKARTADTKVDTLFALGDVRGRLTMVVDDMVTSATTIRNAAKQFRTQGAREIEVIVTHPVMIGEAYEVLSDPAITRVIVTNSLPTSLKGIELIRDKLTILDVAPLLAKVIERIHRGKSVGTLLDPAYWAQRVKEGLNLVVEPKDNTSASLKVWRALEAVLPEVALG